MGESVVLMSYSATVVAYLKNQGDRVSWDLCSLVQHIIEWLELLMDTIRASAFWGRRMFSGSAELPGPGPSHQVISSSLGM